MFFYRAISESIKSELTKENAKIIVVYGARQVGKTTLIENILHNFSHCKILRLNGDRLDSLRGLIDRDLEKMRLIVSDYDIIFIDEAQRIPNIGINLKLLYDNFKHLKIIVTGSSSLDLASSIKETLTGRKRQYELYPISFLELSDSKTKYEMIHMLEEIMIFGAYPEILGMNSRFDKERYITELSEDYLYKDILEIERIKVPHKLRDLLRLIAFQIGSEVSFNELANNLGISREAVARYIAMLENAFVLFRLDGFSRNLRKEASKKPKIYFYDLGVRNAIIGNFNYLDQRNDIGALWENFLVIERLKRNAYNEYRPSTHFWRTHTGAELDYIEDINGKLYGYEFKWNKESKAPKTWTETYGAEFACINKENFLDFIL